MIKSDIEVRESEQSASGGLKGSRSSKELIDAHKTVVNGPSRMSFEYHFV